MAKPRIEGEVVGGVSCLGGEACVHVGLTNPTRSVGRDGNFGSTPATVTFDVPEADFGRYRLGARVYLELRLAPDAGGE